MIISLHSLIYLNFLPAAIQAMKTQTLDYQMGYIQYATVYNQKASQTCIVIKSEVKMPRQHGVL